VADHQPVKLAALEGLSHSASPAPLSLGGIYVDGELRYAIRIPYGLSLLVHHNLNGKVTGLDAVPPDRQPPVNVTHLAYNAMVGIGFALVALALWLAWAWWRRRDIPRSRWFLRAVGVSGVAAVTALEGGWVATEVGRQPWIVYQIQLTKDAVSTAPGLRYGFFAVLIVYIGLTAMTVYVLRRLARRHEALAPQEPQREEVGVP
jgi:cytochrome bd ubiquinol oxidase subunit I